MVLVYWMLVVANGVAFGTLAAGWYAVPVVGLVGALFAPRRSRPLLTVPVGCLLGWAGLLLRSARADGFPALVAMLGKLFPISPPVLAGATLGLALLLGLGAACLGVALRRPVSRDS